MKHIMLDLETMGTQPTAAITAIGAVAFDPVTKTVGEEFYRAVKLADSVKNGGTIDPDTVTWWMWQSDEAKYHLNDPQAVGLAAALSDFKGYVYKLGMDAIIWGNGAAFDNVVLSSAYRALGWERPWIYRNDRCFRTIKSFFPGFLYAPMESPGVEHNALDDAHEQVHQLFQLPLEWRLS